MHLNVTPSVEEQDPPLLHGLIEHGFTSMKKLSEINGLVNSYDYLL